MCLVAEQFPDDVVRSKVMGIILGSMAVGVLLGYPFGSLLYDFVGKMAPFIVISVAVLLNGGMYFVILVCVCVMTFMNYRNSYRTADVTSLLM
jgi:DHA1 family solute carrier family 18 vesicular amine transporter 1/2